MTGDGRGLPPDGLCAVTDQGIGRRISVGRSTPLCTLPGVASDLCLPPLRLARAFSRRQGFLVSGTERHERQLCFEGKYFPGDGDTAVAVKPIRLDETPGRGLDRGPMLVERQQTALEHVRLLPQPPCRLDQRALLHVATDLLVADPRKEKNALTRRDIQSLRLEKQLHQLLRLLRVAPSHAGHHARQS